MLQITTKVSLEITMNRISMLPADLNLVERLKSIRMSKGVNTLSLRPGASWSFLRAQLAGIHEAKLTPATSKLEVLSLQTTRIGTLGLCTVGLLAAVVRFRKQVRNLRMHSPFSLVISTLPGPQYRYLLERNCSEMGATA